MKPIVTDRHSDIKHRQGASALDRLPVITDIRLLTRKRNALRVAAHDVPRVSLPPTVPPISLHRSQRHLRIKKLDRRKFHSTHLSPARHFYRFSCLYCWNGMDCAVGTTDRLSSVSLLMGVESNFGAAHASAVVTWPGADRGCCEVEPTSGLLFCVPELRLTNLRTG